MTAELIIDVLLVCIVVPTCVLAILGCTYLSIELYRYIKRGDTE